MYAGKRFWIPLVIVGLTAAAGQAAEPDADLEDALQTLKNAHVAVDAPALVQFFQKRTLSAAQQAELADVVRRLGNASYRVRQQAEKDLFAAGRAARPFLRAVLTDPDLEIVLRAERLLRRLESDSDTVLAAAAARVLAARKPDGAASVLLAYLPVVEDEYLQEVLIASLRAVRLKNGKVDPALLKALADPNPLRRLAAAATVSRGNRRDRQAVRPLLTDTDARVRYQAAAALVETGDKSCVSSLIALVGNGPAELAWQAEDILYRLAGDKPPEALLGPGGVDRRKSRAAWAAWWEKNANQVDLAVLTRGEPVLGLTLIAEVDGAGQNNQGRISEIDRRGKVRWEITTGLGQPVDIQLLSRRRLLVGEYSASRVTERDQKGKILWERKCTTTVIACQRLPNGNTFITTTSEMFEINPKGETVFSWKKPNAIYYATKLRNGHVLYGDGGNNVYELDPTGRQLWSHNLPGAAWGSIDKLPSGHYLVCLYGGGKVVEVDRKGKVFWHCDVPNPTLATRLANGHVLVGADRRVAEYNLAGKETWKFATTGRVWRVRRY